MSVDLTSDLASLGEREGRRWGERRKKPFRKVTGENKMKGKFSSSLDLNSNLL